MLGGHVFLELPGVVVCNLPPFLRVEEEAREVFSTFTDWAADGDDAKIEPVLAKFAQYCQPT